MSDARHPAATASPYPAGQWNRTHQSQGYSASTAAYPPAAAYSTSPIPNQPNPSYQLAYPYGASSNPMQGIPQPPQGYAMPSGAPAYPPSPAQVHSTHSSHPTPYPPSGASPTTAASRHGHSHSRSYSQQGYGSSVLSPSVYESHSAHQAYLASAENQQTQYPASPQRPYACDMCALSFNRQHDLKRHRETHSGEKPFLCNGGCGKTFTRKDALKRHQLVKRCGCEEA